MSESTASAPNQPELTTDVPQDVTASASSHAGGTTIIGWIGATWGVTMVVAFLVYAIYRLANIFVLAFEHSLDWRHWTLLIVGSLFMAHSEGYKGFQKNYSPRVVARALHIASHPTVTRVLLAPLFCMGYFDIRRRRLISSYVLTIAIVALIMIFQHVPQPWRGMLDAGVVVGLSWGVISILLFTAKALSGREFNHSPEMPD